MPPDTVKDDRDDARKRRLQAWLRLRDVANRRAAQTAAADALDCGPSTIFEQLVRLRPTTVDAQKILDISGVKSWRHQLRRQIWTDADNAEVDRRFLRIFEDPAAAEEFSTRLLDVPDIKLRFTTPGETAIKKLVAVSNSLRQKADAALPSKPGPDERYRFDYLLEVSTCVAAIEQAVAEGRVADAAEITWWQCWKLFDPYFAAVLCAVVPGLRGSFPDAVPAFCVSATYNDEFWSELLLDIGDIVANARDHHSPQGVRQCDVAFEEVYFSDTLETLVETAQSHRGLPSVVEQLAQKLPAEDGQALHAFADLEDATSDSERTLAVAYAIIGLEHADALARHAEEKAALKQQAADALEQEEYERAAEISKVLSAFPAPAAPLYRERLQALGRFRRERLEAITASARPGAEGAETPAGAVEAMAHSPTAEELLDQLARMEAALTEARAQRDEAEAEALRQTGLAKAAWADLARLKGDSPVPDNGQPWVPRPATLVDIPSWAERMLAGRLVLHPRAVRALRKAVFEDVGLIADVLELLAGPYREARLPARPEEAKAILDQRCQDLTIEIVPALTSTNRGPADPQYWINLEGRPFLLDTHVRRGTAKDRRTLLRVYFAWDDEQRRVIVGSLPDHLVDKNSR